MTLIDSIRGTLKDSRGPYANHRERELEAALEAAAEGLEDLKRQLEALDAAARRYFEIKNSLPITAFTGSARLRAAESELFKALGSKGTKS